MPFMILSDGIAGPDFMKPFGKDNRDAHDLLRSSDLLTTELQTSE